MISNTLLCTVPSISAFCVFISVYPDAVATHLSHFGGGVGPTFLSSVNCIGTEIELLDCVHTNSTGTICEDAGAICGMGRFTEYV